MPLPLSRSVTTSILAESSIRNSAAPPPPYWKVLRAISETAVAMRIWSWGSNFRAAAIARVFCRAMTTSFSKRMSIVNRFIEIVKTYLCSSGYQHGRIVPSAREIAVKKRSYHAWRLVPYSWIAVQVPASGYAVRVHDQEAARVPWKLKSLHALHLLPHGAVVRCHAAAGARHDFCFNNTATTEKGN